MGKLDALKQAINTKGADFESWAKSFEPPPEVSPEEIKQAIGEKGQELKQALIENADGMLAPAGDLMNAMGDPLLELVQSSVGSMAEGLPEPTKEEYLQALKAAPASFLEAQAAFDNLEDQTVLHVFKTANPQLCTEGLSESEAATLAQMVRDKVHVLSDLVLTRLATRTKEIEESGHLEEAKGTLVFADAALSTLSNPDVLAIEVPDEAKAGFGVAGLRGIPPEPEGVFDPDKAMSMKTCQKVLGDFTAAFVKINGEDYLGGSRAEASGVLGIEVEFSPDDPGHCNQHARKQVNPEQSFHEPFEGLRFALRGSALLDHGNATVLDTLAHAFKALGYREMACVAAQAALHATEPTEEEKVAEQKSVLDEMKAMKTEDLSDLVVLVSSCREAAPFQFPAGFTYPMPAVFGGTYEVTADRNRPWDVNAYAWREFESLSGTPNAARLENALNAAKFAVGADNFTSPLILDTLGCLAALAGDKALAEQAVALGNRIDQSQMEASQAALKQLG